MPSNSKPSDSKPSDSKPSDSKPLNSKPLNSKPKAALALHPALSAGVVRGSHIARLGEICDLLDPEPLSRFDDPRADALLAEVEVLLTAWGCPPLDEAVLARAPHLRLIAHAAGTVKGHVTPACFERGILASSAAAANAVPVAEYTLAAILFANKRVLQLRDRYRELRAFRFWSKEEPGLGNYRKRVGLVGASRVGRRVLELLRPFDLEVVLTDPTLDDEAVRALGAAPMALDELLATCDVVSLHAPLVPATRGMLDRRRLALIRDGATLINTARGGLVDHAALEAELVSGRIAAVIDTTDPELLPAESPLYELPNVLLTPHIAGSQGDETDRMVDLALDEVARYVRGESLAHAVLREDWEQIA